MYIHILKSLVSYFVVPQLWLMCLPPACKIALTHEICNFKQKQEKLEKTDDKDIEENDDDNVDETL